MSYTFDRNAGAVKPRGEFPVAPEGDYKFEVSACSGLHVSSGGHDMVKIELMIQTKDGPLRVWDNRVAGYSDKGRQFDMISPFLIAVNRIPQPKQELSPTFWASIIGAVGKCRIIQDEYNGVVRNKVAFYYSPQQLRGVKPAPEAASQHSEERDDIPF
jgi:hypothetical protein